MGVFTLTESGRLDSVARDVEPEFPAVARNQGEARVHFMRGMTKNLLLLLCALGGVGSVACQSGGIGDPCIPEDEYKQDFPGYTATQVSVESRSFQCKSRVCLVAYFQGRVSCPYGQPDGFENLEANKRCYIPGTKDEADPAGSVGANCTNCVNTTVNPQIIKRRPESAVYCSCRCSGDDSNVRYCECPSGYTCENLVSSYGIEGGGGQLVGGYCVKEGTQVTDPAALANEAKCDPNQPGTCGADYHPSGL